MIHRRAFLLAAGGGTAAALAGCTDSETAGAAGGESGADSENEGDGTNTSGGHMTPITEETLTVAATTSTYDTGVLTALNRAFEDRYGASVETVAQGTGAALASGRTGDVDVVIVHARALEDEFTEAGYGVNRRDLMFNDFVVVGPDGDPAGIDGLDDVREALQAIAESESIFVSRGDESGTHVKERDLWEAAGVEPSGEWYRKIGGGMGEVVTHADQAGGYALTDRGTYLAQRTEVTVSIHVEGPIEDGPELLANPYGIIAVNPGRHETVAYDLAMAYIGFLTSREGQRIIEEYTVGGTQLFSPEAIAEQPTFHQYVPEGWRTDRPTTETDGGDDG